MRLFNRSRWASALVAGGVVGGMVVGAPAALAAPGDATGTALRVALTGQAASPVALVGANFTVANVSAPPDAATGTLNVAAANTGAFQATSGTATASATSSAAQSQGQSAINNLSNTVNLANPAVASAPTTADTLSGLATCPATGALTAATVVNGLSVFGQLVNATINGAPTTATSVVTVPGLTNAQITAVVRTRIETITADTVTATALQITYTLTGNAVVGGTPVTVQLGTQTAGNATCTRPAAAPPAQVAPVASGLTPPSGPTAGGTTVTITGSGFVPGQTTVTIGGTTVPAAAVTVTSPTQLTFVTPPHAAGSVQATVTTTGGTSGPQAFTYVAPDAPVAGAPVVSGLTPASGPVAGGTTVTITGSGFVPGQTTVTIGGTTVPAAAVTVTSPTQLTFVTPPHAAGSVQATVTTPGGTSGPQAFTYVAPTAGGGTGGTGSGGTDGNGGGTGAGGTAGTGGNSSGGTGATTVTAGSGSRNGSPAPLAYTGVDVAQQAGAAIAILLAGLMLVGLSRRRRA